MKNIKLVIYVIGFLSLIGYIQTQGLVFASSCHGGTERQSPKQDRTKKRKVSSQMEIIELKSPPEMTAKGTLTCIGDYLIKNKKGYWHAKKCKNSAIIVEKVVGCKKSGKDDCPYENKLYHILIDKKSKELVDNRKYRDAKVSISGRFYPDERVLEVLSFRLLNKEEIKEMESKKEKIIYKCPMHPDVISDKPGDCPKCGMKLEKKGGEER